MAAEEVHHYPLDHGVPEIPSIVSGRYCQAGHWARVRLRIYLLDLTCISRYVAIRSVLFVARFDSVLPVTRQAGGSSV